MVKIFKVPAGIIAVVYLQCISESSSKSNKCIWLVLGHWMKCISSNISPSCWWGLKRLSVSPCRHRRDFGSSNFAKVVFPMFVTPKIIRHRVLSQTGRSPKDSRSTAGPARTEGVFFCILNRFEVRRSFQRTRFFAPSFDSFSLLRAESISPLSASASANCQQFTFPLSNSSGSRLVMKLISFY